MAEMNIGELIEKLSSPQGVATVEKATSFAEQAEATIKAAEGWLELADRAVKVAERTGMMPGLMRALGKQYGIDVDTPLKTANVFEPASETHKDFYNLCQRFEPGQINEFALVLDAYVKSKNAKRIEAPPEVKPDGEKALPEPRPATST